MRAWTVWMVLAVAAPAVAAPKKNEPTAQQKDADRHFKAGVALYKEAKYAEALAEFERAYEIAPHPLVLYNIATCHRELSRYGEAVRYYRRFLDEGKGKVPQKRLDEAKTELDAVLARLARVTIKVEGGEGAKVILDGKELGTMPIDAPLIVPPGEHKLVVRAEGKQDAERSVRVASGDEVEVTLKLVDAPSIVVEQPRETSLPPLTDGGSPTLPVRHRRFALGAAFGTNLMAIGDTGAPSIAASFAVHPRVELGVEGVLVAYAVMPSVRVRLAGEQLSVHAAAGVPIAFTDGEMSETFVAGAVGLGLRYRATPAFALRLESFVSFAASDHGTTLPTFVGGEVWF
jgi:hypothetical protein